MRTAILFVVASLAALSTAACSAGSSGDGAPGTSTSTSSATSAVSFCSSYCARRTECDRDVDKQTCERDCANELVSSVGKLRPDVMESARACYSGSDCKDVLSGRRLSECIDEAAVSVAPADSTKRFCDALIDGGRRCDVSFDRAKCLSAMKLFSDETMTAASKCTSKSCSAMGDCIDAELDLGE